MPINLGTINRFFGVRLRPSEVKSFLQSQMECIGEPANLEEQAIKLVGRPLYEAFIRGYTCKQWGIDPKHLPAGVISRLPVRTSYRDDYFNDVYQGVPVEGYTPLFLRMLQDTDVELGVDYLADREYWDRRARRVIFTGPIDRFFGYSQGRLSWRSVRFAPHYAEVDDFQGTAVMNFADMEVPQTRTHEPKHLHPERQHTPGVTIYIDEFSCIDNDAPSYPVNTSADRAMMQVYRKLADKEHGVVFGGRLAEYRYYDMHQVIAAALTCVRSLLN